jgi:Cu+-exporting ATPase
MEFQENSTAIISLSIPHIHCSSCIWILENLQRLQRNKHFTGNFQKKGRITFNPEVVSIKTIVYLLSSIGYEPTLV